MSLVLFYFSGTGNTRYISHQICDKLNSRGYDAKAVSIEGLNNAEALTLIDNHSIIGLGWPIYGSDIPRNMQNSIHNMPIIKKKPLLSFCTQMLFSGDGAVVMRRTLESKGYIQKWAVQFNMPNNYIAKGVPLKGYDDYNRHEKKYLEPARIKINALVIRIIKGIKYIKDASIINTMLAMSQRPAFRYLGHDVMKKWFGVNENCNGCKLCFEI